MAPEYAFDPDPVRVKSVLRQRDEVHQLVQSGQIACPVSLAHAEQSQWENPEARARGTELMLELADGLVMRFPTDALVSGLPVGTAPSLLPAGTLTQFTLDALADMNPRQQLRAILTGLVDGGAAAVKAYTDRFMRDLLTQEHDLETQRDPEGKPPLEAWIYDLIRLRLEEHQKSVEEFKPSDATDLLHTWAAGMAHYGVLDEQHAKLANKSEYLPGQIFPRVPQALRAFREDESRHSRMMRAR